MFDHHFAQSWQHGIGANGKSIGQRQQRAVLGFQVASAGRSTCEGLGGESDNIGRPWVCCRCGHQLFLATLHRTCRFR